MSALVLLYRSSACRLLIPALEKRSLSSKSSNFSSFFFHNHLWSHVPSKTTTSHSIPARYLTQPIPPHLRSLSVSPSSAPSLPVLRSSQVLTPRRLLKIYAQLSKSRLSVLVVLTAMSGVALSPLPASVPVLLSTAFGTALCSASANTFNQIQEVPLDAQMTRTRNRPLVRRVITPIHATAFGLATGIAGPVLLYTMVNPTTALLGALNIVLYAGAYTALKRTSILNTWVGGIVGAIPPVMGWTACGGHILPFVDHPIHLFLPTSVSSLPLDSSLLDNPLAPLALFMLLFSWQFPHFNSLSHFVRDAYAQAGYHMLSVISPSKNALVSLRHSLLFFPLCSILIPISGLTTWTFALTSIAPNAVLAHAAWQFWKSRSEKHARTLFHHSLWWLPVVLGLMMFHKQGLDWSSWIVTKRREKEPVPPSD